MRLCWTGVGASIHVALRFALLVPALRFLVLFRFPRLDLRRLTRVAEAKAAAAMMAIVTVGMS